jgi:hypothetical protein
VRQSKAEPEHEAHGRVGNELQSPRASQPFCNLAMAEDAGYWRVRCNVLVPSKGLVGKGGPERNGGRRLARVPSTSVWRTVSEQLLRLILGMAEAFAAVTSSYGISLPDKRWRREAKAVSVPPCTIQYWFVC